MLFLKLMIIGALDAGKTRPAEYGLVIASSHYS